ncbi:MAG: hypothetical protein P1U89_02840 [Verrucomicrobiales bacterium]|nr:hypothetical protein [Verrucomicrobiales bacterium]
MKSAFFVFGILVFLVSNSIGQNAVSDARKKLSERGQTGNTGAFVSPSQSKSQTIVSYVTFVSKEREWSDAEGRKMTGRLVAFSAPEPGKTGPVVILKDGMVRLRRTGAQASNDLPLEKLSQADQLFVKALEAGIKKSAAQP